MSELRRFFRCPILPEQQDSVLLFGEVEVPVRLSDMSANGFTAWVNEDSTLKVGDVVQVHAAGTWIPGRIVNSGLGAEGLRLGIERVGDRSKGVDGKEERRGPLRTLRRILSDCSTLIVFVTLALGVALGTYVMGAGTSQSSGPEASNGSRAKASFKPTSQSGSTAASRSTTQNSGGNGADRPGANRSGGTQMSRAELPAFFPTTPAPKGVPVFLKPVYDGASQLVWRIRYGAGAAVSAVVDAFRSLLGPSRPAPEKKQD